MARRTTASLLAHPPTMLVPQVQAHQALTPTALPWHGFAQAVQAGLQVQQQQALTAALVAYATPQQPVQPRTAQVQVGQQVTYNGLVWRVGATGWGGSKAHLRALPGQPTRQPVWAATTALAT